MKPRFTKEELHNALYGNKSKAEELVRDQDQWESFKKKFQDFLIKGKKIPVLGSVIDDVMTMVGLADAYVRKEYTDIPLGTIIAVVAALIYVLSPIDLIPDVVPGLGYVDDVAVITMVLHLGVDKDLDKFRKWKNEIIRGEMRLFQEAYADELKGLIGGKYLAAAIYEDAATTSWAETASFAGAATGDKVAPFASTATCDCGSRLKLLLCEEGNAKDEMECTIREIAVPDKLLYGFGAEAQDDILGTLQETITLEGIRWVSEKEKRIYLEPDFEDHWDEYIILEE